MPTTPPNAANSGTAVTPADFLDPDLYRVNKILSQLNQRIGQNTTTIKTVIEQTSSSSSSTTASSTQSFVDTHANRLASYPATKYAVGSFFYETDRTTLYQVQVVGTGNQWIWIGGQMSAALASIPTDLGMSDAGFLYFENAKYYHQAQWTGSAWQRGPNDTEHSNTFHEFGAAPTDGGWHSCNGSTQNFFNYTNPSAPGSTVLPNLTATPGYSKCGGAYNATVTAADNPTFTGTPATPAGTVSQPTFTGTPSGSTNVLSTGGVTAVVPAPFTPAGTVSQPAFTGTPAAPAGTVALPGDPVANWSPLKYFRL